MTKNVAIEMTDIDSLGKSVANKLGASLNVGALNPSSEGVDGKSKEMKQMVDVVHMHDMHEDKQVPLSDVKGLNMVEFAKLIKSTAETVLGKQLTGADIAVVRAVDMKDDTLVQSSKAEVSGVEEIKRPKLR